MENLKNVTGEIYRDLQTAKTKIGQKCYNILNYDLCEIYIEHKVWWLEKHSQYTTIPNYFVDYMARYMKRKYNVISWLDI